MKISLLLVSLCFFCSCMANQMNLNSINLIENVFIEVPDNVDLVKDFPVEDFMLADFSKDDRLFLKAYVGNAPAFPSDQCSGSVMDGVINGLTTKTINCNSGELFSEVLVELGADNGWPQYVHFMLHRSSQFEMLGNTIISSVTLKK